MSQSKQVNFFLFPDDILVAEDFLKNQCNAVFLADPANVNDLRIVETLAFIKDGETFSTKSIARQDYLDRVHLEYIKEQDYWLVDRNKSEVIEFSPSFFDDSNALKRGRFYTRTKYYDNEEWKGRDPEFIKWSDKIYRWFKKTFVISPIKDWSGWYMSPAVIDWVRQGGKLTQM